MYYIFRCDCGRVLYAKKGVATRKCTCGKTLKVKSRRILQKVDTIEDATYAVQQMQEKIYGFSKKCKEEGRMMAQRFQVDLESSTRMGKISKRPASIPRLNTNLLIALKLAKLQVGPTASKPGPMLLKVQSTAEKLVPMEKPSSEMIRKITKMITI